MTESFYELGTSRVLQLGVHHKTALSGGDLDQIVPMNDELRMTTIIGALQTPGGVFDIMKQTDHDVGQLDVDITTQSKDGTFVTAWKNFQVTWSKFFADHQSLWSRLNSGSVYDQTNNFRTQLATWYTTAVSKGIRPSGAAPAPPFPQGQPPPEADRGLSATTIILLTLGGVAVTGLLGFMTYRYLTGAARQARKAESMLPYLLGGHSASGIASKYTATHHALPAHVHDATLE